MVTSKTVQADRKREGEMWEHTLLMGSEKEVEDKPQSWGALPPNFNSLVCRVYKNVAKEPCLSRNITSRFIRDCSILYGVVHQSCMINFI